MRSLVSLANLDRNQPRWSHSKAIGQEVPGAPTVVGTGAGAGFTVNLGWDCVSTGVSMGNADYAEASYGD